MAHESMQHMTHKQLATIVLNPEVGPQDARRDWARYYALLKNPWKPIPEAPKKKKVFKDKEKA
jgi:hypothetical protein